MPKKLKVFLDPGHGGHDLGACFRDLLLEKDVNLDVCLAAAQRLQFLFWTALSRHSDLPLPLSNRWIQANAWKADISISIHCNADPDADLPGDPEAKGEEIWIYKGSQQGLALAQAMKEHVDTFFPDHGFRGIRETTRLGVLQHTNMPAILIELGFLDHMETSGALQSEIIKIRIGHLISAGVQNYARHYA